MIQNCSRLIHTIVIKISNNKFVNQIDTFWVFERCIILSLISVLSGITYVSRRLFFREYIDNTPIIRLTISTYYVLKTRKEIENVSKTNLTKQITDV